MSVWKCRNFNLDVSSPLVMGIVNVTPDSFSDGIPTQRTEAALHRARSMARDGAAILDLGAESTRPGATPLSWQTEWARLEPVLKIVAREMPSVPVSIDTYHPETAERAIALGASIVNCVYPDPVPQMADISKRTGCGLVAPCRSQSDFENLSRLGLGPALMLDPMVGFGTTRDQDLEILGSLRRLAALAPTLIGVSRKRIIGAITGVEEPAKRLGGSVGAAVWCALNGAAVLRVHDVKPTVDAIAVARRIAAAADPAPSPSIQTFA